MKTKATALLLALSMLFVLTACSSEKAYKAYNSEGERYDCYLPDYIKVGKYKGISVPLLEYKVTNDDIDRQIKRNLAAFSPDIANPDYPAEADDIADIITTCYVDGEPLPLLTFKKKSNGLGQSFVLGCYTFGVPDLDNAVIGMKVGETKKTTIKFPDPYYKDLTLSGKEAEIEIYLNNFYDIQYPEPTDELFLKQFGYTIESYEAYIRNQLQKEYDEMLEDYKAEYVWSYIFENSQVLKMPEEYDKMYNELLDDYRKAASEADTDLVNYVSKKLGYESLDDFYAYLKSYTEDTVKREMILYYIARCENINYTEEFYESELLEFAKQYELTNLEDAESFVDYYYGLEVFKEHVRLNYVYKWLGDNANVRKDVNTYVNNLNK